MNKLVINAILIVLIVIGIATTACIRFREKEGSITSGKEEVSLILVPVEVNGANKLGSLYGEMVYDPKVLFPVDVGNGSIAKDALLEYSIKIPGRVIFGIVDEKSIDGDGAIVIIRFQPLDGNATSQLELQNVVVHDVTAINQLTATISAGSVATKGQSVTSPEITFLP